MTNDPFSSIPSRFETPMCRRYFEHCLSLLERHRITPAVAWREVCWVDDFDDVLTWGERLPDDEDDDDELAVEV